MDARTETRSGATERGLVTDMGALLSFSFHDPDGAWHEIIWEKPGAHAAELTRPEEWEMVDLD